MVFAYGMECVLMALQSVEKKWQRRLDSDKRPRVPVS